MHSSNDVTVRVGGILVLIMSFGIFKGAAVAGDSYIPAPPIAVPVQPEHDRHGLPIAAHHPRTRLVDGSGLTSTPRFVGSPSFFPPRPANAEIRYRTGVLTDWVVGNKSAYTAITDAAGNTFSYFTGWPMFIDGKQTHCAIPPRRGFRFAPFGCQGGWPADVVIGATRVRVYYWHDVTPWGQHVEVTDQIIRVPRRY